MPLHLRRLLLALSVAAFAATPLTTPPAVADGAEASYVAGGTAAVRNGGSTTLDEGVMTCTDVGGYRGAGGFCLPFGGGDAVRVADQVAGENVAFQVCLDQNGDGACTSPDEAPSCPDVVVFSHDDNGAFFNPVGPLPTGFDPGCGYGAFPGYVVFLCEGVHADFTLLPHVHPATAGTATVTSGGEGLGTFCGADPGEAPVRKRYRYETTPSACRFVAVSQRDVLGPAAFAGAVTGGPVDGTAYGLAPLTPVTLTCTIRANGTVVATASYPSTGIGVLPPAAIAFATSLSARVEVCATLAHPGGTIPVDCATARAGDAPSSAERGLVDRVAGRREVRDNASPVLCPALGSLAGGYGTFTIAPDGDVLTADGTLYDCPPVTGGGSGGPSGDGLPQVVSYFVGGVGVL